jgi:oxygen-independent coproporphyrinogen-3 oxidase
MKNIQEKDLIKKYNVPGPRYTSYPTVPYWDLKTFSAKQWQNSVTENFNKNKNEGLSLYIHLPYCESLCTFCACNTRITVNHKVEEPYIKAVLKEWSMYKELFNGIPKIKEIHLGGGTPTFFSPENLEILLEGILKGAEIDKDAEFGFEAHPNNTTKEHLEALYKLGFRRISFGIQDFDKNIQTIINRIQTFETVKSVTDLSRSIGYTSVNFDLIYGLPFQTLETITTTIQKVGSLLPDRIAFYSYAHVPWIKPGQRKFTEMDLPEDEQKRKLYEEGRKMFEKMGYEEIGMDHFALSSDPLSKAAENKTLHRNFMGYTTNNAPMLIGMGVSSISDIWNAFSQNVKTVEEYVSLIEKDILPVFRGHILNQEDLSLRKHILNLMCRMETSWNKITDQSEALYSALNRMKEFEEDGLIKIDNQSLRVEKEGKAFLRNICMGLDARMWKNEPSTSLFSKTI